MTNVTVCNSQQTRKRVAKETTPPKKKERPERVEGELHVHGIAAGFLYLFLHESISVCFLAKVCEGMWCHTDIQLERGVYFHILFMTVNTSCSL